MAEPFDLLLRRCRLPDGRLVDLGTLAGTIAEIGSLADRPARRSVDCGSRVLTPGLVDAHIHLDKALLSVRAPSIEGTVAEALRVTAEAKRAFTVDDIRSRARRVLDAAVRAGTTAMRSHVEIDPIVGLKSLEALVGQQVGQVGVEVTRRNLNIQPTIIVRPGYRFFVRVEKDLLFKAPYSAMPLRE